MRGRSAGDRRPGIRFRAACVGLAAVLLAACGASDPTPPAASSGAASAEVPASGSVSPPGAASPVADGLPAGLAEAIAGSASLERVSSFDRDASQALDEAIGVATLVGPELQAWLMDQRSAAVQAALEAVGIDPSTLGPTSRGGPVASIDGSMSAEGIAFFGAGMAVSGLVQGGLGHIGSSFSNSGTTTNQYETTSGDRHVATTITTRMQLDVSGSMIVADADLTETDVVTSVSSGASLGTTTTRSHVHVEAQMCPDPGGNLPIAVTTDISGSGDPGGSSATSHTGTRQVTVGEDAEVASDSQALDSSFEDTAPDGTHRSGTASSSWSSGPGGGSSPSGATFTSQGDYTPGEAAAAQGLTSSTLIAVSTIVLDKARAAWQGGKCVELTATEQSRTVDPREVVRFTVQPRQRIERVDLSKPVVAAFSGKASVDPVDTPVNAPARFTFTAGRVDGDQGTVDLTSTSNRGIGTLTITFTVEAEGWFVDQAFTNAVGATGRIVGEVCGRDPETTWVANGTYRFLVFRGKQKWKIVLDGHSGPPDSPVYSGRYTYRDDSRGPYGVKQWTDVTGTVEGVIDDDGNMHMTFTETSRSQHAEAPPEGTGSGPDTAQPTVRDLVWTAGADC